LIKKYRYEENFVPSELILIRHGEVDANLYRKVIGYKDPPLNKQGYLSAERTVIYLQREEYISAIYSSPRKKAKNIAKIVALYFGLTPIIEISLREWDNKRNICGTDRFIYLWTFHLSHILLTYSWILITRARIPSLYFFDQDFSNII